MSVEAEIIWLRLLLQVVREQGALERTAAAPHPAEVMGFDAWMTERKEAAHAEFIKRTSVQLPGDWRVFHPEAIARYFDISFEQVEQ